MWFNSKQRAEPYQLLTWEVWCSEMNSFSSAGFHTGAAWLSSARVVRCWVKSRNERNPYLPLPSGERRHSKGTAGDKPQHAAVNTFPGLVHTARHTMGVALTRSRCASRKEAADHGKVSDWGEVVTRP